ncbi:MAG TPA: riboflavin synthase [Dehalococcoidia bacterium]|jgi:riboflavin synthase|nr:riboflavin synthase [Chloroflexota bacterium]MDP5877506.1 riboflavin synthase [Dehalococcoidia bacterium]MDP6274141.1 riboflavin synthase [Dehalococcoidia bacterium]MDP7159814.1 riboflavin synthase [Dehalococcoidia bacterium]MDP7213783.1 riboflavin synthase [Dehalococcoidia bacterium]|tara:strand:- start:12796 stop:13407 length:612 start_codon:yes stop_codon:yes gene_type:complete
MFTGIVEEVGEVISFEGMKLTIHAPEVTPGLQESESICVAGACLTVMAREEGELSVEVIPETLSRTNLSDLKPGGRVNLERSLAEGGRIGGHMVQGHVDDVAEVSAVEKDGDSIVIRFLGDESIMRYIVPKGFITVDGASLTVVDRDDDGFSVAIIPYTYAHTTIAERTMGSKVNIEVDVTAKYVEQMARPYLEKLLADHAGS